MLAHRPHLEPAEQQHGAPRHKPESNHAHLRRATRQWHDDVDAAYTRFDLALFDDLAAFLRLHARAVAPLEVAIARSGASMIVPEGTALSRSVALAADLATLGVEVPPPADAPELPSALDGIGALYVLEGAKLGGRVLLRQVLASPDPRVRSADRFLRQFEPGGWRAFLATLDALPSDPGSQAALVAGACGAFALFLPPQRSWPDPSIRRPGCELVQRGEA